MMVLRTTFDPLWTDVFFGDGVGGKCETPVKQEYWKRRSLQRAEDERRAREPEHAKGRMWRLEQKLREGWRF